MNKAFITSALSNGATDQVPMPPTNSTRSFHDWSPTGGLRVPQPDNREETQLHGDTESCMAVLNNYYGDGEWNDIIFHINFRLISLN